MASGHFDTKSTVFRACSFWFVIIIWCISLTIDGASPHHRNSIIHLTNENWQAILKRQPLLLVLFHSSHCTASVKLKDELKDFRKLLHFQNSKVEIAELDIFHFEPIMRQIGFPGLSEGKTAVPFVGFFFDAKPHLLNKKKPQLKDIRKFMRDVYFSKHFKIFKQETSLREHLQKQELTLIFNGQHDHPNFYGLIDWSLSRSKLNASVVVYTVKGGPDSTLPLRWNQAALYRRIDDSFVAFSRKEYDVRHIEEWIYIHSYPALGRLDKAGFDRLVADGNPALVLFAKDAEEERLMRNKHDLSNLAEKYLEKLLFLVCSPKVDSECNRLLALCQLDESNLPILEVVHIPDHNHAPDFVLQYVIGSSPETSSLDGLVERFLTGELDPWVKSEPAEDDLNASQEQRVTKLVGTTISAALKFSNRRSKDLLVLFHEGEETEASQKALAAFMIAASYLPPSDFSLVTYDHNKNTRVGLSLTPSSGTHLRFYRYKEHSHHTDRQVGESPTAEGILEFAVDAASTDLSLPGLENVRW